MINTIIIIFAITAIITKLLDCYTTAVRIKNIKLERNPIARKLMSLFGVQQTIWGIWVIEIIVILASVFPVLSANSTSEKVGFIIIAFILTIAQGYAAWNNSRYPIIK